MDLVHDGLEVVLRPVHAEAEMPAGERAFHDDVIGQAVEPGVLAQEQQQRAQRRNDDAELDVAKARMVLHQRERSQVQPGAQRDAVDPAIHRRCQAHAQRFARAAHGELFHAVDEDQAFAPLGLHGPAHVQPRRLGQPLEIELHHRLVGVEDVVLVLLLLLRHEPGLEPPVRNRGHHRVGDVADSAEQAATSASSAVEMSTPIPPVTIGTSSLFPSLNRKSSTRFMQSQA